jgi:hypothetical protein
MKNVYKLMIVVFSIAFISSGVFAQINNVNGNNKFNEDQLKLLKKSGLTERALDTQTGLEKANEVLKTYYYNMNVTTPQKSSFSSKAIKNPDASVTVTIGTETNISGAYDTDITPFGTYYEDGQNQYLFTAYELGIAGIGAGEITEIGWHVAQAAPDIMNGFNIEVKHSTAFTVTGFEDDFTNVYSGIYTADTGWNMFEFTEPFMYDGSSSLLVKVCFDNEDWDDNSFVYYSITSDPMNGWAYNDGTTGCTDPYEGSSIERPNTRITGEEMLNPPPGIPYDEIPISGTFEVPIDGDITWSFGDNTETYSVWFGPEGAMELVVDNEPVPGADGIYTYTGLEYATTYEWQVIATNEYATTNGPIWVFASECATVTPPYTETFTLWPPICWNLTGGTYEWQHYTTGVECAYANFWGQTSGNTDVMTTPPIDITGANYGLEFMWSHHYNISYPNDSLVVYISDDDGVTWTSVWSKGGVEFESNDGAGNINPGSFVSSDIISLSAFNSPIQAQFIGYSGYGPNCYIDDVKVFEVAYGSLDGTVTDLASSNPIEGAIVKVGLQTDTTDANGMYSFAEVLVGPQMISCTAYGHNDTLVETNIVEGELTTEDIAMTAPVMEITPDEVNVVVDPFGTLTEFIDIANTGNGELMWTAVLDTTGSGNDSWISVTQFAGTVAPGDVGQMQLDFDANTIIAGTVLNGTITFTSDPEVGVIEVPVIFTVGDLAFGHILGNVFLDGIDPYNIGDVTEVTIEAGPYYTSPDENGDYDLMIYPGTFDITATLYGYTQQSFPGFVVEEGITYADNDFTMPCIYGKLFGNVTDVDTGDPIENAQITALDEPILGISDNEGNYEVFIEAGVYTIQADHPTYAPEVVQDIEIVSASDTEQDFALTYQCEFCEASGGGLEHITGVEFGSISNLNNGYNTGYEDFTSMSTLVIPGFSYDITINIDPVYTSDDYGVWIDWNFDCTFDPETENVLCEPNAGAATNTWTIEIPPTAQPGVATMRVRMKWSGSDCGSPCGTTSYGEVEDYSVIIAPGTYGSLSGFVTELSSGNPIEGAIVEVAGFYADTTLADGSYYFDEVITGTWEMTVTKDGYNDAVQNVTIEEDILTEQDVEMTAPELQFTPESISISLEPNQQSDETVIIENIGNGPVDWSANVAIVADNSKDIGDIVFELAVGNISGEQQTFGSEWDGIYLWTTGGASFMDPNQLYKFDLDGTLIAQYDQPLDGSSSGIRDLAFDGTYLYGGNEVAFYQIDPADGTITELFDNNFGQTINALAYVPVFDAFYSKNQASDLISFDMEGNLLSAVEVTGASNVTGAAWDNISNKLWLFNESGSPQTTFLEYDIVSNQLTGVEQQVATLSGSSGQTSQGAFFATDMIPGYTVLGGTCQGTPNMAFAMDMGSSALWINIDVNSGTLEAGEDVTMTVSLDATDLLPAVYEADIVIDSDPYLGDVVVPVSLTVEGLIPPVGLFAYFTCTDVHLQWNNPGGTPDSYNIYKNDELLTNTTELTYNDMLVMPLEEVCYTVTSVYGSEESQPTAPSCVTVPYPENIGISFIDGWPSGDTAYVVWEAPAACVAATEYNVYRNSEMIGSTADTVYTDTGLASDFYEYYVTASYYFGESENSDPVYILITSLDENLAGELVVSPNPAIDQVKVQSVFHINSYSITDAKGRLVESKTIELSEFTLNMTNMEPGVYYVKFETDDKPVLRKIILK